MTIAEEELAWNIKSLTQVRLPAYEIVKDEFERRLNFHASGEIMLMRKPCPWKSLLLEIEKETGNFGIVKFVLYPDGGGNNWRISTVPPTEGSFGQRVSLKKEWRGVRDSELAGVSGIEDAIFVHVSGFIGGAKSQASCIRMAEESIAAHKAQQ